jgi:hypothetical protein
MTSFDRDTAPKQGDQMSFAIAQNVAQNLFLSKLIQGFNCGKSVAQKCVLLLPKVNNHLVG